MKISIFWVTLFVALQVLPPQKIIVGKISHGGGAGGLFEKNRLKVRYLLVYKLCFFFNENCLWHICYQSKSKTKNCVGLYDDGTHFEKTKKSTFIYILGP